MAAAVNNRDVAVVDLLARALPPGSDRPDWLIRRLRQGAAQAAPVGDRPLTDAGPERHRSTVLNRIADALTSRPG